MLSSMAQISASKLKQVVAQCGNARTRTTKWIGDITTMVADPRAGDMPIVSELTFAREAYREAVRLLATAQGHVEKAQSIVENRKKASL